MIVLAFYYWQYRRSYDNFRRYKRETVTHFKNPDHKMHLNHQL